MSEDLDAILLKELNYVEPIEDIDQVARLLVSKYNLQVDYIQKNIWHTEYLLNRMNPQEFSTLKQ